MKKISLILLLLTSLLAAQSTEELHSRLLKRYGSITSFQADIKQENHYVQLGKSLSYSGKFYFQQNKMLMAFSSPSVQRLYIKNGKAELYDEQSNALFKSAVMPQFNKMNPLQILQLYWQKSDVSLLETKAGISKVRLVPHQDALIGSIEAWIDASGLVSRLSYMDKQSNRVTYSFSDIRINRSIAPEVWKFKYPSDTQIIEQ